MAVPQAGFAPQHTSDRAFFAAFLLVSWLGVLFGFFPASSARIMGRADYVAPLILHIHAASFVGWLALLTAQVFLIRTRRQAVHRSLGRLGWALVPVMAYSSVAAELYSQRFYIQHDDGGLDFFILPLLYVALFTGFTVAGLRAARRDPAAHKRLILMGTTVIVGAAYARWWGAALTGAVGDDHFGMIVNTFLGTNLILAAAAGYDLATRGRVHRAYCVGIPIILAAEALSSWIYHAAWWLPVSRQLIELRLPLS
jgi:uncharacterized membrane protein